MPTWRASKGRPGASACRVKKKARSVDASKCTGCGACQSACPVRSTVRVPEAAGRRRGRAHEDRGRDHRFPRGKTRESMITVLQDANKAFNYLPEEVLHRISSRLGVPFAEVYGAASFYKAFSLEPRGAHVVQVCVGTACHVRGAQRILEELERRLGVKSGSDHEGPPVHPGDGQLPWRMRPRAHCGGGRRVPRQHDGGENTLRPHGDHCTGGPHRETPSLADLEALREERPCPSEGLPDREIVISTDSTCCILRGSLGVAEAFKARACQAGLAETSACAWRVPGLLRDRAHGRDPPAEDPLPEGRPGGRVGDHGEDHRWRRGDRAAPLHGPGHRPGDPGHREDALLPEADASRPGAQREDRARPASRTTSRMEATRPWRACFPA